jgi:hypothetical protein
MLDLFNPPKPVAIQGPTRRVLLMDARGVVTPDAGQLQPKRPSKFDGWTAEQFREYRRKQQNARNSEKRKEQVRQAGLRYRARKASATTSNGAGRHAADSTLARVGSPDPFTGGLRDEHE